jgi:hypothetical protein
MEIVRIVMPKFAQLDFSASRLIRLCGDFLGWKFLFFLRGENKESLLPQPCRCRSPLERFYSRRSDPVKPLKPNVKKKITGDFKSASFASGKSKPRANRDG